MHYIANVREALGEAKEFKTFLLNYDLSEYPILNLFSADFVNKILKFKSSQTVIEIKQEL